MEQTALSLLFHDDSKTFLGTLDIYNDVHLLYGVMAYSQRLSDSNENGLYRLSDMRIHSTCSQACHVWQLGMAAFTMATDNREEKIFPRSRLNVAWQPDWSGISIHFISIKLEY